MLRLVLALALTAFAPLPSFAQHRLADAAAIDTYLEQAVAGKIPGVVAMVADANGVLYSGAFGRQDVAKGVRMTPDSIFRLASMTKPVTSVAVMMLVEEGKLALDDPVEKYLPAFKDAKVFTSFNAADKTYTSRPASTPVTVRHLLTHTSGLGYSFSNPILAQLLAGDPNASATRYPLLHDPGTKWTYGESTRVLGTLVEKISGKPLDQFMQERIFKPLGMNDTSYAVPAAKLGRVATVHRTTDQGLVETPNGDSVSSPVYGDGGLNGPAADYVKFMQMLLRGGRAPDGTRLLSEASVRAMGQTQTGNVRVELQPTANRAVSEPFPLGAGRDTFGLGFQITGAHDDRDARSPGSMSWAGIFNTEFWIDPRRGICAVLLMQYLPFYDAAAIDTLQGFEKRVYQGLGH
ncbi:MAG TPA: serine hydrolase domain-containing protein [Gammaproteobacteria bacterium]|nr:serine hydrolase domain-containing protein [Gammaproteobacteria bacterium]